MSYSLRISGAFSMRAIVTIAVIILPVAALAEDVRPRPADVKATIDRGIAFLAKDAMAWKEKHNCVSCHHAGLVVWSLREAKLHGYSVDEGVLSEMTEWVAKSGDGKTSLARPDGKPKAVNAKAIWLALALGADPKPDAVARKGLNTLLATVKNDQTEQGAWTYWPETRPPLFGNSDESMTTLATLALSSGAIAADTSAISARDKGVRWLIETPTDGDAQSIAMRVVLWQRLGRKPEEWKPLAKRIRQRQNADGGWSQANEMASDAWATGQALYALARAGVKPDDPVIERAHAFLIRIQREDGSWPMTSRPAKPGGDGSTNLVPIIGAGSAWALLGMVQSR
jgi:hypothetical protein